MTTTLARLRVGQRFSFIPAEWYGPCKLISKCVSVRSGCIGDGYIDIKYNAAVVNPPGIAANTRVRVLVPGPSYHTPKRRKQ